MSLMDQVAIFLKEEKWSFQISEDFQKLRAKFSGEHAEWYCCGQVMQEGSRFVFYSEMPLSAPLPRRFDTMKLLTYINQNLAIGNFEISSSNGEVRYKTSTDLRGCNYGTQTIGKVISINVLTMNVYLSQVQEFMRGDISLDEAVIKVGLERHKNFITTSLLPQ